MRGDPGPHGSDGEERPTAFVPGSPEVIGDRPGHSGVDVIELGSAARPPRPWWQPTVIGLLVLAVVVGAAAGYLIGDRHAAGRSAAQSQPSASIVPVNGGSVLAGTGQRCSSQRGSQLQVGVEVINQSAVPVTLNRVSADLPLGGLRATGSGWGGCGVLPPVPVLSSYPLPPGGRVWLTMTFDVLTDCPGPLPVLFSVNYQQAGRPFAASLGGFSDLGDVPYTGCSATPS